MRGNWMGPGNLEDGRLAEVRVGPSILWVETTLCGLLEAGADAGAGVDSLEDEASASSRSCRRVRILDEACLEVGPSRSKCDGRSIDPLPRCSAATSGARQAMITSRTPELEATHTELPLAK